MSVTKRPAPKRVNANSGRALDLAEMKAVKECIADISKSVTTLLDLIIAQKQEIARLRGVNDETL
jgi:hypothetical protein